MKNKGNSKKAKHFLKHYAGLLLLALVCAAITVILISFI